MKKFKNSADVCNKRLAELKKFIEELENFYLSGNYFPIERKLKALENARLLMMKYDLLLKVIERYGDSEGIKDLIITGLEPKYYTVRHRLLQHIKEAEIKQCKKIHTVNIPDMTTTVIVDSQIHMHIKRIRELRKEKERWWR